LDANEGTVKTRIRDGMKWMLCEYVGVVDDAIDHRGARRLAGDLKQPALVGSRKS